MSDLARHWRLREQRYRLEGTRCPACGRHAFPPEERCADCGLPTEPYRFAGRGEVYSHSTVYQPPQGFEAYAPYAVALVKLEEGPMVTAQLTDVDPEDVAIGMPVEMVTRKLSEYGEEGLLVYGYKFRPPLGS